MQCKESQVGMEGKDPLKSELLLKVPSFPRKSPDPEPLDAQKLRSNFLPFFLI